MSSSLQDTGCCGENLKTNRVSLLGIYTLSYPLAVLLFLLRPGLRLCVGESTARTLSALAEANDRIIAEAPLLPRFKCVLTARVYNRSPRLSGFLYRNFNLLFFVLTTFAGILLVGGVWALI